jgi:hypothetical protein
MMSKYCHDSATIVKRLRTPHARIGFQPDLTSGRARSIVNRSSCFKTFQLSKVKAEIANIKG